jgi:hypothetical protein
LYAETTAIHPQGETLKPREDGTKKAVEQSKAVINLKKNTEPSLQKILVKHLCTARPAGEIDQTSTRRPLKKITAIRNHNYTEHDENKQTYLVL